MGVPPASSELALQQRLLRFWWGPARRKDELVDLATRLRQSGTVAVFGGMVRDFAIQGAVSFRSDVDLVVETDDPDHLDWLIRDRSAIKNRFGGWRLQLDHWMVDLWAAEKTWAFAEKHVDGQSIRDLTKTTFFNWDAAVFEIDSGVLHLLDGYVASVKSGVLDINLAENPNPPGIVVRALELMRKHKASVTPRLAWYLANIIARQRDEITHRYGNGKHKFWLTEGALMDLQNSLNIHFEKAPLLPFQLPRGQERLL